MPYSPGTRLVTSTKEITLSEPTFESPVTPQPLDPRLVRLQGEYTDEELLLELRRRGRIARVDAHTITPGRYVSEGFPMEEQVRDTYRQAAQTLAELHLLGKHGPGCKWEEGHFEGTSRTFIGSPKDRKLTVVVNYIVEKGK